MELLGVGPLELLLVILLALVLIGPRELGNTARAAGRFLNRLYRSEEWSAVQQASRNLRNLPARLAREAELEEQVRRREELDGAPLPPPAEAGLAWRRPTGESPADASPPPAQDP
jgi:sec-independent protein translocase protein TatB